MSQEPQNHEQMLAEVRRSQDAVRDRVAQGSWRYDLLYSSVAAVMVAGQAAPMPFNILASTGSAIAFAPMWRNWSDKAGVSITGYSPKRARWIAIGMATVFVGLMLTALYCGRTGQPIWALPLGAVAFVAAMVGSRLWMKVYLAETARRP